MNRPLDYSKVLTEEERGALLGDDPRHSWVYSREDMWLNRLVWFCCGMLSMSVLMLFALWWT